MISGAATATGCAVAPGAITPSVTSETKRGSRATSMRNGRVVSPTRHFGIAVDDATFDFETFSPPSLMLDIVSELPSFLMFIMLVLFFFTLQQIKLKRQDNYCAKE